MTKEELLVLIDKYLAGTATVQEEELLEQWYATDQDAIAHIETQEKNLSEFVLKKRLLQKTLLAIDHQPLRKQSVAWMKYAAAILLIATATYGWIFFARSPDNKKQAGIAQPITAPGAVRALLTLSDGRKIALDSAANGLLTQENNISITKTNNGEIIYAGQSSNNDNAINTVLLPRGSQVLSLILSDGTRVWLNAGSQLKYPVHFTGNERKVEIEGEGYFEVAANARQPFIVSKINTDARVLVLGTSFNVNAYTDEPDVRVTLINGKVRVQKNNAMQELLPGQEGVIQNNGSVQLNKNADTEARLAWKNGRFILNGASLREVMRQISRWYDVEIIYAPGMQDIDVYGAIERKADLQDVLQIMERTGEMKFTINNKTITVMKQ